MTQSLAAATSLIDLVTHDWKKVNFAGLRAELDDTLEQWHNLSEENKKKRTNLGQINKDYRQCTPGEKKKKLGSLMKAYQDYIDEEGKRCKFLETAYLKIFQVLTDAPDPVDALNEARAKLLEAQKAFLDLEDMKVQMRNYESELNSLKNQEITVRNLKEQLEKKEVEMQQKIAQAVMEETQRLEKEYDTLLQSAKQTENEQRLQLQEKRKALLELQKQFDEVQNNLLSQNVQTEESTLYEENARTLLEDELERANVTILALQKEKDTLNAQLEQLKKQERHRIQRQKYDKEDNNSNTMAENYSTQTLIEDDLSLLNDPEQMQMEIRSLRKKINDKNDEIQSLKLKYTEKEKELHHVIESNRMHIERLQQQLEKHRSELQKLPSEMEYENLKKKVSVLQQQFLQTPRHSTTMTFDLGSNNDDRDNGNQQDNDAKNPKPESGSGNNDSKVEENEDLSVDMSLETLFYRKTRKLETQITQLKLDLYKRNDKIHEYENELEKWKEKCEEQQSLISNLENDLSQFVGGTTATTTSKSYGTTASEDSTKNKMETDALSRLLSEGVDNEENEKKVKEEPEIVIADNRKNLMAEENIPSSSLQKSIRPVRNTETYRENEEARNQDIRKKSDTTAFSIVCQQRDRFRERATHLESDLIKLQSKCDRLEMERSTLKSENLQLYSKIKFLETYNQNKASLSNTKGKMGLRSRSDFLDANDVEMKYAEMYEQQMNPFTKFKQIEKQQRIQNLQWTEWIAYVVGSTVLSRKTFRVFTVFYALALHLLTFFALYHEFRSHGFSHTDCVTFTNPHPILNP